MVEMYRVREECSSALPFSRTFLWGPARDLTSYAVLGKEGRLHIFFLEAGLGGSVSPISS